MTTPGRRFNTAVTRFWSFAAPAYDVPFLQRWVYQPAQDEVVAKLRAAGAQRIADIACGTGILAARVQAELNPAEVYGVDMSEGMLEQAKARSPKVRWLRGPAERLPFEDGSLDAVVTTSAFHWFDQPAAMRDFHRVLVPGGLVAVATITPPLPRVLARFARGNSVMHSPGPAQLRTLFTDAGFRITDQRPVRRPAWAALAWDRITVGVKDSDRNRPSGPV